VTALIIDILLWGSLIGVSIIAWRQDKAVLTATPGGPVIGFSIGAVALKSGGGMPQVVAYIVAWALFAFQRLILWEIPFMPARFVWFRAMVSLPFPFLAAAIVMVTGKP
jgi:hypothetical protein